MVRELVLVATILFSVADAPAARLDARFQVVVHPANPVSSLRRAELSAMFLRKMRSWPDGTAIQPVEPPAASSIRDEFSREIHGKTLAYVTRYWHRLIFAGRGVPPAQLRSDGAVLEFVRRNPGAVGYIGRTATPGNGVKVIEVTP